MCSLWYFLVAKGLALGTRISTYKAGSGVSTYNPSTWRQEDCHEFRARLDYRVRISQKPNPTTTTPNLSP